MRILLTFIVALFLNTFAFAQTTPSTPKGMEDIQQEMQKQMKELGFLFGDSDINIDSIFQNFGMGGMNLDQFQDLENLNPQELMEQLGGGNGLMMPENFDMESMMKMLEESMGGNGMGDLGELLAPFLGDMENMFPQQREQEERILKGEDGQPIQPTKKKKSKKKVYKL